MNLRQGTKDDFDKLLVIWEASVRATHDFLQEADITFYRNVIVEHNAFAQVNLICATDDNDNIMGFAGVSQQNLEMLFIEPACRGKGVGKKLLNYTIYMLNVNKVDVNEQNPQAIGFYEHAGFVVASRSELDGMGKPFPILHMELQILK